MVAGLTLTNLELGNLVHRARDHALNMVMAVAGTMVIKGVMGL